MNRNRQENDPQRDRSSRNERSGELGHVGEDVKNRSRNRDIGRQQAEGDLGNERQRDRDRNRSDEDTGDVGI